MRRLYAGYIGCFVAPPASHYAVDIQDISA